MSQPYAGCPTCEDALFEVEIDQCDPSLLDAGLLGALFARPDKPFANIEDPAEHTNRTNNTSALDDAVRRMVGTGSWTVEFGQPFKIGRKTYYAKNKATFNLKVYYNNETNYNAIIQTGCNGMYKVWPLDSNNLIYGGNDGINMVLQGRENIVESLDEKKFLEFQGVVEFTNAYPRNTYPLAGELDELI